MKTNISAVINGTKFSVNLGVKYITEEGPGWNHLVRTGSKQNNMSVKGCWCPAAVVSCPWPYCQIKIIVGFLLHSHSVPNDSILKIFVVIFTTCPLFTKTSWPITSLLFLTDDKTECTVIWASCFEYTKNKYRQSLHGLILPRLQYSTAIQGLSVI